MLVVFSVLRGKHLGNPCATRFGSLVLYRKQYQTFRKGMTPSDMQTEIMYYIGVDLGGTNIAVGIVNTDLQIIEKGSVPTNAGRDGDAIVKDMADLCLRLLNKKNIPLSEVAYVGIASPGAINSEAGIVANANNLPFDNYPMVKVFSEFSGIPKVYIANDANAAALAEAIAGAAKDTKYSVMITLGTGVGGGIVLDGQVYSGFNAAAGELGHMVIHHNGRQCSCGRRGCFEAYSSATGLTNMTKEKIEECNLKGIPTLMNDEVAQNGGKVTARTAFSAMKKGDIKAKEVVDMYIDYLADGLASIINIFQPEVLSIGGGVCNEREHLLTPLLARIENELYTRDFSEKDKTKIKIAELGNDAGILGAAVLGLRDLNKA